MKLLKHFLFLLVLASSMTAWLFLYKPRHYEPIRLITSVIVNVSLWMLIFGIPYVIIAFLVVQVKRKFFSGPPLR